MAVTTVRNANRLATQGRGLPQAPGIALGALTLARLQADLVVATGGVALWLAEASRSVQLVARVAQAGAVEETSSVGTSQRTRGHTVVAVIQNKVGEALANATGQAEAVLLAAIAAVGDALAPVVLVAPPPLATYLDHVEVGIRCAVAHNFDLLVVLEEHGATGDMDYKDV